MRLELLPRTDVTPIKRALAPLWAIGFALLIGAGLVILLGRSPLAAFKVYFLEPLTDPWALQELAVKATPLIIIATGLVYCFRANLWNIGAEGQLIMGAIVGSIVPLATVDLESAAWVLPLSLVLGILGGALYGAIPALLRNRFGVSEILVSLMLVYIAELTLDYLVRGPWRDPKGFNFPTTPSFPDFALLPNLASEGRLHAGLLIALLGAVMTWFVFGRTMFGFGIRVAGEAPRAARFAGFNAPKMTLIAFLISGGMAGLAGIVEVTGQIGQLKPAISGGLGFTAIIVAYLGRLHPVGIIFGAFTIALTIYGGEAAQIALKLPLDLTRTFQGILLFCVLAADALTTYRLRLVTGAHE
ncbi:MAG: ABC transporter permease [Beijerinckiaceae bacterium]|nr:ABC transporter permease [Beijerinckiaceae bacterium]